MEVQINDVDLLTITPAVTIDYDAENDWICVTWTGNHSKESALVFTKEIEAALRKENCRKILNINENFYLSWQEAPVWAIKNWFPRLFILGCTSFAWVLSPRFSSGPVFTEVFKTQTPFLQAMVFTDEETASAWLNEN
ncbi:hypothetical protein I5M27_01755 [Adhaeribacter sp. BT258]|uniref:STAS/SEC14 domain-containing protein n=1 Tax=Adhaeribacter terrigena TaxID=2793070 RepID=A0ABS1BZJ8_9BACT|nr:hypothetical protein [Adhaeribacter terrigena]MBK0401690.1 hypothetical protein [Adhaeribacter terrigena]